MEKQIKEFFATHPDSDEVYEALGYLFTTFDQAKQYCAGSKMAPVTHQRSDYDAAPSGDTLPGEPVEAVEDKPVEAVEDEPVDAVEDEPLPIVENDATTYGQSAEEVAEKNEEKKKPAKKAAKK